MPDYLVYIIYIKNKDPGKQGENLESLEKNNKDLADAIKDNAAAGATENESDRNAWDSATRGIADAYNEQKNPKIFDPGIGPPPDFKDLYKRVPSYGWKWKDMPPGYHMERKSNDVKVNKNTGRLCSSKWSRITGGCKDPKDIEGELDHGVRKKLGWGKDDKGNWGFQPGKATGDDVFKATADKVITHYADANNLDRMTLKEINKEVEDKYNALSIERKKADKARHASAADAALAARLDAEVKAADALPTDGNEASDGEEKDGKEEAGRVPLPPEEGK